MRSQLPSIILIAVIASLCFSVGEGLRLTPFPRSIVATTDATNVVLSDRISDQISLHRYGPLDVPTQSQKRNKRQVVDFACPPIVGAHEISCHLSLSIAHERFDIVSVLFVSRPAGRAPPLVS